MLRPEDVQDLAAYEHRVREKWILRWTKRIFHETDGGAYPLKNGFFGVFGALKNACFLMFVGSGRPSLAQANLNYSSKHEA